MATEEYISQLHSECAWMAQFFAYVSRVVFCYRHRPIPL